VKSASQGKWNTTLPIRVKPTSTKERTFTPLSETKFTIVTEQTQLVDIMKSMIILSLSKYISSCFMESNRCLEIGIAVN
jgi:hypothetical protein